MMGIGFPELMVILVIIMIIFGAGKLPQIGSAFGNSIKNFKTSMREAEQEEESTETASVPEGEEAPVTAETSATGEVTPTQSGSQTPPSSETATAPAPKPAPSGTKPATAKTETAKVDPNAPKKPAGKKGEKEKTEAEKMIEDAIDELKEKRIGTIRTPHDGLVQQNDVFTGSLKKTPFGRGRDRGVRRDVI